MHPEIKKLLADGPIVTDGGWGTQLQLRGLKTGECPDQWNLSHPEAVKEVASLYVDAGSDIILTNTFGANRFMLERHDLANEVEAINREGVRLSKEATGERAKVFASIGPSGVVLLMGQVSHRDLQAAFEVQAQAMADAGADGIVIETMGDPDEIKLAITAARTTGLPVVACMVFDSGAEKDRTMMGTTPEQAAEILVEAGAEVIGSNCGQGVAGFVNICRRLHAATDRPIWIKANAGLPEMVDGQVTYQQTPEQFAEYVPQLVDAGASMIGGCCGTTPEFIAAVKRKLS